MTDKEQKQLNQLAKDLELIKSLQASDIYTPNYQEAMALFSIGYRKAGIVRKETATGILKIIDSIPTADVNELNHLFYLKQIISKEYGVEVKE